MNESLGESSHVYEFIAKNQGAAQAKQIVKGLPLYWGSQPIANAPFYYGAILCFCLFLACFW
jgi:hypothetical protein